ncbi:hypothetical protein Dimus_036996 [Dionaea muscipula]
MVFLDGDPNSRHGLVGAYPSCWLARSSFHPRFRNKLIVASWIEYANRIRQPERIAATVLSRALISHVVIRRYIKTHIFTLVTYSAPFAYLSDTNLANLDPSVWYRKYLVLVVVSMSFLIGVEGIRVVKQVYPGIEFCGYGVLGDDVVIADPQVAKVSWVKQWLNYVKWYHSVALSPDVTIQDFFEAPQIERKWKVSRTNRDLKRFGLMWKIFDMVALKGLDFRVPILESKVWLLHGSPYLLGDAFASALKRVIPFMLLVEMQ